MKKLIKDIISDYWLYSTGVLIGTLLYKFINSNDWNITTEIILSQLFVFLFIRFTMIRRINTVLRK